MSLRSAMRAPMLSVARTLKPAVLPVVYSLLQSRITSRLLPFDRPPILLLSYPRSGSTWVGRVLATSPRVAYLNEPITRPYHLKHGGTAAVVDLDSNASALSRYRALADDAFRGAPPRDSEIVIDPSDFAYPQRLRKRLLIKEVNPRATAFYCERYQPQTLLLLRHPAAIALSFFQLGWLNAPDVQPEGAAGSAGAWEGFGYVYGTVMHKALETLRRCGNSHVVLYTELARDPYDGFRRLFESVDLPLPAAYETVIQKFCYSPKAIVQRGQVERTSKRMIDKWRTELTAQQIADLRAGFLRSPLGFYRDDAHWR